MSDFSFDPDLCARCGGRCCRETPGVWVDPQRFHAAFALAPHPTPEAYDDDLARLELAWRDLGGVAVPVPQSREESGCNLLTADGCRLAAEARPCQCLALEPNPDTLRQDDFCCELPDDFRLIQARRNWTVFWER